MAIDTRYPPYTWTDEDGYVHYESDPLGPTNESLWREHRPLVLSNADEYWLLFDKRFGYAVAVCDNELDAGLYSGCVSVHVRRVLDTNNG